MASDPSFAFSSQLSHTFLSSDLENSPQWYDTQTPAFINFISFAS